MYARLSELIQATKEIFSLARIGNDEEVVPPDQRKQLVDAAMSCVRSAGECVNKTRFVIEKIGDFEVEPIGLGSSDSIFDNVSNAVAAQITHALNESIPCDTQQPPSPPPQPRSRPPPLPLIITEGSPLPDSPTLSPTAILAPNMPVSLVESPVALCFRTSTSSIPSLSNFTLPHLPPPEYSPANPTHSPGTITRRFFGQKPRVDSVNVSNADSNSTYPGSLPGDGASIISHTSTRATTPEQSSPKRHEEPALLSSFGSASELHSIASEDCRRFEAEMCTKTYACELVYNKDGQICGGSLPALVEKLTAHESTPDAIFLTTFYLTFRLFTTPIEFAKCLVDRFEYVGENEEIGVPVRLRVYNVFKGWLESHWQADSDSPALGVILAFATGQLRAALPAAGRRLAELTVRVTEVHAASLVPQLVSSMGKTSTSSAVWSATEGSAPSPIITRSQLNALRNARSGGLQPSILDFDPFELARQFTIIESRIFNAIQPEELLGSEWTKKTDSKAVNVRAMARLSTDLANLVADTILSLEDPKKRAVVIKQWVKIAMRCLELNNYDSLMAIICSLNSSMVLRLKRTWDIVPQKTKTRLEDLRTIVDVSRNYAVLRQRLQNHVAPCIPFVGIYLTDLTFVDVGNTTTRQLPADGSGEGVSVINFDKHVRTAKIIGQLQRFQVPYKLSPIPEMQEWMERQILRVRSSDQANVQSYYRRSLVLEPRETQQSQLRPALGDSAASTHSVSSRETAKRSLTFSVTFRS
ncbi:Ras guanine nucleotide exchange factor bud5 [Coniosporium tulheliwenetii]|uniref:Ras guanine nucleotide exchange factor bud5 n=1 Tax=Coniosporium tulheliwenetii TaxID=3383036 RepID=A0ACC2Z5G0_9PEZI|nr:Ras guanine nucleotide exchange factor bud5 [Cladosporium sp. JES 115]